MKTLKTLTTTLSGLALALALLLPAGVAAAAPPSEADARFEGLLAAIDVIPESRAQLERGFPDARARLLAAAQEEARDLWTRSRAIGFLGFYPETEVRSALTGLVTNRLPEVRKRAIYQLARTFGQPGDAALVALVDGATRDPDSAVREAAVRGLRWVDGPGAAAVLERVAKAPSASPSLRSLATFTAKRRAARLGTGVKP